ncbi:ABC transporter ATP-binding protein [Lysinibacillus capsici]|uniref:ABC transporter ATP-binding protein n=1 Tax=Lysinibacillus capsici TaxID=2115968 RepID=UPI002731BA96|nr:ABC transporter ATP-binding protein [Lysinibacillus capsici]MDP1394626.1 ABC transporter ATP-binding protein [Lysinibacillus capsici]MDP1415311.1 ABC transporter ATP-binding protein [Lysinibacillus capsici]MDP1430989.1 ABC transporter ATP-binding protein [Lysinibacillus capsici]
METAIKLNNISKIYKLYDNPKDRVKESINPFNSKYHKEFYALKEVSFELKRGETIGIIGKNGSGKSTLLKIIAGVLSPTSGDLIIKGKITSLLELGAGFNPEYTGIENIFLNGTIMGYTKEEMEKKIPMIEEFADIGDFIHKPVKQYSSGMFARLAFSTIISFEPDILIVDEALAVGDVYFQQKCNIYMKNEMKNTTKLLVTHDMNAIANMVDRAILLSKGEIKFDGEPLDALELYTKELHSTVFEIQKDNEYKSSYTSKKLNTLDDKWTELPEEKLGGALEVKITHYLLEINSEAYKGYIKSNDLVKINFVICSTKKIKDLIIGYLVNDKHGNNIFGENSLTSGFLNIELISEGLYNIEMSFKWPEIKEGHYFLTLGIGEGLHELSHTIQCWAHNILELNVISPNKTMHALFNNNIRKLDVKKIEE